MSPNGSVSVNYGDTQTFNITANADYYIVDVLVNASSVGAVNSYTFTNVQASKYHLCNICSTPTLTPTPTPTLSPSPTTTQNPAPTPTPNLQILHSNAITNAITSPTPLPTAVLAKTDNGATVELAISGNITSSQISNATITSNQHYCTQPQCLSQ